MQNIVFDMCEKFHNDRLKNSRALVIWKSDNNNPKKKHNNTLKDKNRDIPLLNLTYKRRYVCLYAGDGRPNVWADQDQTWHGNSCWPRECFRQDQAQGHVAPPGESQ